MLHVFDMMTRSSFYIFCRMFVINETAYHEYCLGHIGNKYRDHSKALKIISMRGRIFKLKIPIVKFKNKISGRAKEFLFVYSYQAQHKRTSHKLN